MQSSEAFERDLDTLLDTIYQQYNQDFRDYSPISLQRRVKHALRRLGCETVAELQLKLAQTPALFTGLLQYLTVSVSELFRDPLYFRAVRELVVPVLQTYSSRKIWIAGCSSGEEVCSLAIVLHEEGLLEKTIIYATDINPAALDRARKGIFGIEHMQRCTENYQRAGGKCAFSDYYSAAYGSAIFDRALLRNVVFADHSLATDSVFTETQFISCRNVLIYFNRNLKERAFKLFHESLARKGLLGLGSRENMDFLTSTTLFEPVLKSARLFRKI
ncbi:MAG TPA: CheR family methyltransferase [Spongiibacteraceae bacterium]|nr:CheR family methyltransferase [Spongiibacteraceae bacterium]